MNAKKYYDMTNFVLIKFSIKIYRIFLKTVARLIDSKLFLLITFLVTITVL